MTFINYASREVNCKIAYDGPGLSGTVENLQFIYEKTNPSARGKLITLPTESERILFFDFVPHLGNLRGFKTRFHLYSVPEQVSYDASRKLILKGVDGVVFVADSQRERMEANVESLRKLKEDLKVQGYDLKSIPYVLQLNKRDLPTAVPVEEMRASLGIGGEPVLEAVADSEEGIGVFDTLKAVAKLVLEDLTKSVDRPADPGVFAVERHRAETPRAPAASIEESIHPTHGVPAPAMVRLRAPTVDPQGQPFASGARDASVEIGFDLSQGSFLPDLVGMLQFPFAFLVATALFLEPGAAEHLALNAAYCVAGLAGALWIHHRNERERAAGTDSARE